MPSRDFKRSDRIAALLRREVGTLVHAQVREHGLPSVSVSDVEVTRDFDVATVWVTALISEQSGEAIEALNGMTGELRHQLAGRVLMRRVPELRFKYDDSVDKGERIDSLLRGALGPETPDSESESDDE